MSSAEIASINSEFDIFAHKPVQKCVYGTIETAYKHIAPVDQNDLEFLISSDKDNYIVPISNSMSEVNKSRVR